MSKIEYTKDDMVVTRQGEFYEISSCYMTPRRVEKSAKEYGDMHRRYDPIGVFSTLHGDVDELLNKPRRFFDRLLSIMEWERDHDPMIDEGNHREYWNHQIKGCEMWLSAVENGLYGAVEELATKVNPTGANTGEKE